MLSGFPQVTCSSVNLTNQDHLQQFSSSTITKTSRCFQITATANAEFHIPCTKTLLLWFNIQISVFTGKTQCSWKHSNAALTTLSGACLFLSSTLYIYLTLLVYSTHMCEFTPEETSCQKQTQVFKNAGCFHKQTLIYGSEELRNIQKHTAYQESTIVLTRSQHAFAQQKHIHIIYNT